MTGNERIGGWLGWEINEHKLASLGHGGIQIIKDGIGSAWWPDRQIERWHSPDGLLEEIGKQSGEFREGFLRNATEDIDEAIGMASFHEGVWAGLIVTPAQLTVALVKMIEEME